MLTEGEQGSFVVQQVASLASTEATGAATSPTPPRTTVTTSSGESAVVPATPVSPLKTGAVSYFPSVIMKRNELETGSLVSSPKRTEVATREVSEQAPTSESPELAILDEATGQAILLLGSDTEAGGPLFLGSVPATNVAGTNTNHSTRATGGNSHVRVGENIDNDESQAHQAHPDAHLSTKAATNLLIMKRSDWWGVAKEFRNQEAAVPVTLSVTTPAEENLPTLQGQRREKTREDACDEMRASILVLRQIESCDQQALQSFDSPDGSPGVNSRFTELHEQEARNRVYPSTMNASQDIESESECIQAQPQFQTQDLDSYAAELFPLSYGNPAPESNAAYNYNTFVPEANSGEMYPAYSTQGFLSMALDTYPEHVYYSVSAYNAAVPAPSSLHYQSGDELLGLAMPSSRYQSRDSLPVATLTEPEAGGAYDVIQHSNGVGNEAAQSSIYRSQNNSPYLGTLRYPSPTTQRASWMTPDHSTPKYASRLGLNVNFESISALVTNSVPPLITETSPDTEYSLSLRRDADNGGTSNSYFSSQRAQTDPKELGLNPGFGASTFGASRYGASTSYGTGMSYGASTSETAPNPMGTSMFNMLNRGGASLSLLRNEEPHMYSMANDFGGSQDQESLLESPVRETGSHNAFATAQQALAERAQDLATLNSTYVQEAPAQAINEGYNPTWRNNELVFLEGRDAQAHHQSFSDQLNARLEQTDNDIVQYGYSRSSLPSQVYQHSFFQTNDLSPVPGLVDNSQSVSLTCTASQSSFPTQVYQHSFFQTNDSPPSGLLSSSQNLSLTTASEQPSLMLFNNGDSDRQSLMLYSSQGYTNQGFGRLDTQLDFFAARTSTSTPVRDSRNESSEGSFLGNLHRFFPRGQVQLDDAPMLMPQDYPQYQNVHTGNAHAGRPRNDQFQASSSSGFNQRSTLGDIVRLFLNELVTLSAEPRRQRTTATHDRQGTTQAREGQAVSMTSGSSLENNQALAVNDGIGAEVARLDYMLRRGQRTLPGTLNSHFTDSLSGEQSGEFDAPMEATTENLEFRKQTLFVFIQQVDRSWKTYSGHLIEIINLFNSLTCPGAATPYTALALQAMSRYFKCLRDALSGEYKAVRRRLGEQDTAPIERRELSASQLLDQQMRRQRTIQQLSTLQQHAWRPQRGLPERAVIVLRSWLLEHFLHPYPKDLDKAHLAKQTGLLRNQVANWFINARVRLWKPMVEEMYSDEFNSDQTGSRERSPPRPFRPPTQMLNFSNNEISAATSSGQAEALRLNVDEGYFPHSNSLDTIRSGSASDSQDFNADPQAGVHVRRRARTARYGPSSYSGPSVGMNMELDVPVVQFQDQCNIDQGTHYSSSPAEYYIRQQEILASNRARYSVQHNTGDTLTGFPNSSVMDLLSQVSNPRVSLTLGLESLSGASPHQRYGFQREPVPTDTERSTGGENTVRNMDSGPSLPYIYPAPHNSSPGSSILGLAAPPARRQRGAIPHYQLRDYIARGDAPAVFLPQSQNDGYPRPL